ncbi:mechanosensitive ion channel family protein [Cesiribacter andamanensis]|nr:mechanosensitive ion channel family protein [Cesiribacter andamanensis]
MIRLLSILLLFLLPCLPGRAQEKAASDSLLNQQLQETTQLLRQKQQQQLLDSLRRQELQKEIERLSSENSSRRSELEARLREITLEDSLQNAEKLSRIAELRKTTQGFPVAPFGDTLYFVFTKVGSFNVQERARAISERIEKLYKSRDYTPDSIQLAETESGIDILHGRSLILMSITELDALWLEKDMKSLAGEYASRIRIAIDLHKEQNSLRMILIETGLTLLLLAGLFVILRLLHNFFRWLKLMLLKRRNKYLKGIRIKDYQLFDTRKQLNAALLVLRWSYIGVVLLALYLALPLLFSIFPQTQAWSGVLLQWILAPVKGILLGILNYLPNLFTILVIFIFTRYTIKALHFFATEVERGALTITGFYRDWAMPTFEIIRFLLYVFMFIVIFPYLPGSDSPIFQGVSVFLGILFSLGSSSAISNIVAGLVITYMRPFRIGDRVKIGDITGDVVEKTLLVTRLRTTKNEDITVPNSSVLSGHTVNYTTSSQELGVILHTTVTIGYDVPWRQVHELLTQAARRTTGVMRKKAPFVLQTGLEDFYVSYQLNVYSDQPNRMAAIYSELHRNIQDAFNEGGVEILSPHYRAQRDGNTVTIPPSYLPKDYQAPSFRVETISKDQPQNS